MTQVLVMDLAFMYCAQWPVQGLLMFSLPERVNLLVILAFVDILLSYY